MTREFLEVYSRLLKGEKVDFHGDHIRVEGAEILFPPVQEDGPPLYFGDLPMRRLMLPPARSIPTSHGVSPWRRWLKSWR
ncbi:hypothetical protein ERHA55_28500 [Erwinia rhapontici]|nr:hypothetical protein ERHA55_28500 [Erwinia rhapontici]